MHDSLRDAIAGAAAQCLARLRRTEATSRSGRPLAGRSAHRPDKSGEDDTAREQRHTFWAVRDVSFDVAPGEAIGIIGPNGAGKSTILKLLAGILRPERGTIRVGGRLAALIEVGAGFHGDLTGRENIFLNGAILGMGRDEVRRKLDAIVAFAGVERFLDMPVKRYSSGMYARLGFSIAAHVDPDVLLVDEVLSVGDAVFRLRCLDRMRELVASGTTLIFVTHDLDQMLGICSRTVVLEAGRATFDGAARQAVGRYLHAMSRAYAHLAPDVVGGTDRQGGDVRVAQLRFLDANGDEVLWVRPREPLTAELVIEAERPIPRLVAELNMRASLRDNLLSVNSGRDGLTFDVPRGCSKLNLILPRLPVSGGQYLWNARIWDADRGTSEADTPFRYPLVIDDEGCKTGLLSLDHEWCFAQQAADVKGPANAKCEMANVQERMANDKSEPIPVGWIQGATGGLSASVRDPTGIGSKQVPCLSPHSTF